MSTNATIIVQRPGTQEFASIYTHWDGYPSHHGKILLEHYDTYEKVVELIQLGGLSELHPTPDACVAFHRDRGEELTIRVGTDLTDHSDFEYAYLFRDGLWFYKTYCTEWEPLTFEACVDQ
jgi:hypothetical protein